MARKTYSAKQKAKILKQIEEYNEQNGRGGSAYIHNKTGISYITLRSWLGQSTDAEVETKDKPPKKAKKKAEKKVSKKKRGRGRKKAVKQAKVPSMKKDIFLHIEAISSYEAQIVNLRELIAQEKQAIMACL